MIAFSKKPQDFSSPEKRTESPFDFLERARLRRVRTVYLFFIGFPVLGMLLAAAIALFSANEYQATGLVRLRSPVAPFRSKGNIKKRAYADEVALLTTKKFRREIVPELPAAQRAKLRAIDKGFRGSAEDLARLQASLPARVPSGISIFNKPGTSLLRISVRGEDPELSAAVVNAVINGANQAGAQAATHNALRAQRFYATKLAVLQEKIDEAQAQEAVLKPDIADILASQSTVVRSAGTTVFIGKARRTPLSRQSALKAAPADSKSPFAAEVGESPLEALERAQRSADLAERLARTRLNLLQSFRKQDELPLTGVADPLLEHLDTSLNLAQEDYAGLAAEMGPNQPELRERLAKVQDLRKQIATAASGRMQAAANAVQAAGNQSRAFRASASLEQTRLLQQLATERNLAILEIDLAVNLALFQDVSDKMDRLLIIAGLGANRIEVVDLAEIPLEPVRKAWAEYMIYGSGIGLLCALLALVVLLIHTRSRWVADEVEDAALRGVLAIIPRVTELEGSDKQPGSSQLPSRSAFRRDIEAPLLSLQDAFRLLFTSDRQRVVTFTSALPAEGKTTIACTFAEMLARGGERVLLIDADMRRPKVQQHFRLQGRQGLSHVLTGAATLAQAAQNIPTELGQPGLLDVLVAGPLAPSPGEAIRSVSMQQLIAHARAQYRYVILDTPSVLSQGDAASLASLADAVILVVRYDRVTLKQIRQSRQRLSSAGVPISATVINAVPCCA